MKPGSMYPRALAFYILFALLILGSSELCLARKHKSSTCQEEACRRVSCEMYGKKLLSSILKDWYPWKTGGNVEPMKVRMFVKTDGEVYGQKIVQRTDFGPMNEVTFKVIENLKRVDPLPRDVVGPVKVEVLFFRSHRVMQDLELDIFGPKGVHLAKVRHAK
ncbi:MAG: hypothetical protein IPL73_19990 [Candidatus Obscuribacter sp.]|nr:hypothetical protein [Candidatus Obscuribacter sp.]